LAQVHPDAAMEVFERDCLIYLGTCVAAKGVSKPGKPCFKYRLHGSGLDEAGEIRFGELKLIPFGPGQEAEVELEPARGFDLGAGSGKRVQSKARGGTVGIVLDGRGRPLVLPEDPAQCRTLMGDWVKVLGLYADSDQ
ncbi:MAG: methylaspartate mutase, partial [Verrucomicrobiota bacterium]|nr:methylaspartate mutase [Verrucomicrobiota bacterium]